MPVEKREKPILFSTEMVKAILEGRKTQTRRVINYNIPLFRRKETKFIEFKYEKDIPHAVFDCEISKVAVKCPWQVGQELWVKETHFCYGIWVMKGETRTGRQKWVFKRLGPIESTRYIDNPPHPLGCIQKNSNRGEGWHKRNSLFMPKELSRIQLLIKDIRVERVQDINVGDVLSEGVFPNVVPKGEFMKLTDNFLIHSDVKHDWVTLWDSINANRKDKDGNILPYSWNDNPYVWALDFERIK